MEVDMCLQYMCIIAGLISHVRNCLTMAKDIHQVMDLALEDL